MSVIAYVLTAVIVYLGLPAGMIIGRLAEEELKPGKKYITFVQDILLAAVVLAFLYYAVANLVAAALIAIAVFCVMYFFRRIRSYIIYPILGLLFYFSADIGFLLLSSLIFLYGIPTGSLELKTWKKQLFQNIGFLVVALILPAL